MSTTKKRKEKKRRQRTGVNRSREVKTIIIFNEGRGGGKKGGKKSELSDFEYRIPVRV